MRQLPHGTVTFLFTDIEGSTRLLHELGGRYAGALADHRRLLREAFARHGGVEVDTQGDALFYAFPRADEAVAAAADGQTALDGGPVAVRMGLHTGSPDLTSEGYVGVDVHLGARVAAAGHGRQVLLSGATRALVDAEVLDLGEHRLKDFDEAIAIYQLGTRAFPPLKTISNTNLPRPASAFVGRDRERAEVVAVLREARLVTLTGPGGSGKTRLAIEAAAELVPETRAGVFWVGLATVRNPALVMGAVAQAIGAKDDLAGSIGERDLLLLLDNFEQVVDAAPEVAELVEACPNLRLLVTSRELLRVRGELEYAVLPLAEREAVELFCTRAAVAGGEAVEELCRRLDNLPLAIELAAARANAMSARQLVERIGLRLDLLRGGRDVDARQQTLRATIAWSHDLLDAAEARLFARLAVFGGGCTLEAAEDVCEADVEALQALVDKSLVRHTGERFWMLETIREFAAERLDALEERNELARRHAEWCADLGERLELSARHGDPDASARLAAEVDNMRSALEWLARAEAVGEAFRVLNGLWFFWVSQGLATEGLRWARWAVAQAPKAAPDLRTLGLLAASDLFRAFGEPAAGLRLKLELLPELRERSPERHFPATLADAAEMLAETGEFEEARRLGSEALAWRQQLGEASGVNHALSNLATVEFRAGDFERARQLAEEALALVEEPLVPTNALYSALLAGEAARRAGAPEAGRRHLLHAIRLSQTLGQRGVFPELLQEVAAVTAAGADSVRILAVSERLFDELGLPHWDPADYERTVTTLRADIGDRAFEEAWTEGAMLPADEALALAVGCLA